MEKQKTKTRKPSCCQEGRNKENKGLNKGFWHGVFYGLIPHTGCIAFVLFTVLGVTAAASILKPLLLNANLFYALIALSFVLATISGAIYLKRNQMLSFEGIKKKKSYLTIMYGTTILLNLLFFFVVFPLVANLNTGITGSAVYPSQNVLKLQVAIPCPGHAPLISNELKTINGVTNVRFDFPNLFYVGYDSAKTNEQEILSLNIFKKYTAKVLNPSKSTSFTQQPDRAQTSVGCCGGSSCGISSGGSCSSCSGTGGCGLNRNN